MDNLQEIKGHAVKYMVEVERLQQPILPVESDTA